MHVLARGPAVLEIAALLRAASVRVATMRKVGNPKAAKAKADKLFSLIIRSRGACENCGRSSGVQLQCAHIISRRFSNTRCVEANAFCLDAACHAFFTDHPASFGIFVLERIGQETYQSLLELSQQTHKVDWNEVAARLEVRWKEVAA